MATLVKPSHETKYTVLYTWQRGDRGAQIGRRRCLLGRAKSAGPPLPQHTTTQTVSDTHEAHVASVQSAPKKPRTVAVTEPAAMRALRPVHTAPAWHECRAKAHERMKQAVGVRWQAPETAPALRRTRLALRRTRLALLPACKTSGGAPARCYRRRGRNQIKSKINCFYSPEIEERPSRDRSDLSFFLSF